MDTLKQEREAAAARRESAQNQVRRFYVKKLERRGSEGYQEHEIVILDEDARNLPFAHEHVIPGKGGNFRDSKEHVCVDDTDNCVLCRAREMGLGEEFNRHPNYNMYGTILDLTPYTIQNGPRAGQVVEATRRMFVVGRDDIAEYQRIFDLCYKRHGTTRGMVMVVTKHKKTDARCGKPIMLENGMLFDMMDEEELESYSNERVVVDGRVLREEGEDIEPLDYDVVLAAPDQRMLRRMYNLPASVGSEDDEEETTGSTRRSRRRSRDADDEAGEAPPSRRSRRTAAAQEDEYADEQDEDGDDNGEPEPPARTRSRRAPPPDDEPEQPRARSRRSSAPQPEPEPEPRTRTRTRSRTQDAVDDAPPPPSRRRRGSGDDIPF